VPILTRLGTDYLWREGFQVCSNEGDCPSPRGDNSKRINLKNHLLQRYKLSFGEGNSSLFKYRSSSKERYSQKCKNGVGSFKNLILKNYKARKAEFYMKAF
jgi:hypothetical protein